MDRADLVLPPGFPEVTLKSGARYNTKSISSKKINGKFYILPLKTCFAGPERTIPEILGAVWKDTFSSPPRVVTRR